MFNLTPVVRAILIANVLVFFVTNDSVRTQFGLHSFLSERLQPIQFLTHMFLHDGWQHIFSNMLGLIVFGPMLERVWGVQRFIFFYLVCGLGASLLYLAVNYFEMMNFYEAVQVFRNSPSPQAFGRFIDQHASSFYDVLEPILENFKRDPSNAKYINASVGAVNSVYSLAVDGPMVGASGAIFGVIMAFGLLFPNTELFLLFPPIPIKAKYLVLFYGAYELYSGVYQANSDNVAHFAHIGGMLFAFILVKIWGSQRKTFY